MAVQSKEECVDENSGGDEYHECLVFHQLEAE
jgi:hypothetical protein